MRAIRAIALMAALVMALMSVSATSAIAVKAKGNANGYAVSPQGTLSFHASTGGKGGFIFTPTGEGSFSGKVTCYSQDGMSATFVGVVTKTSNADVEVGDTVQFNLRDNNSPTVKDAMLYTENGDACGVNDAGLIPLDSGDIKITS